MTSSQTNTPRFQGELLPAVRGDERIIAVGNDRLLEAVEQLLAVGGQADSSRARRFISFSRSNHVRLDRMWARLDGDGRILHTTLVVPSPGRTAMFFASRPRRKSEIPGIARLIDHACQAMAADDIALAQVLLDPTELLEREAFLEGGFHELARLSYMERPLRSRGVSTVRWPSDVTVEQYREELEPELLTILDASYEDTLDCPGLRGLRTTRDILVGHRGTGAFDPSLWTVLRVARRPAGALLLYPSSQHRSIELVYIGLAKFARGRGLGKLLLRHGFNLVAARKERLMTLAVDERNSPALALYRNEGFRRVVRRVALIRKVPAGLAQASADCASA